MTLGNQRTVCGKKVMIARTTIAVAMNGAASRTIAISGFSVMFATTNRSKPKGGVKRPIMIFTTIVTHIQDCVAQMLAGALGQVLAAARPSKGRPAKDQGVIGAVAALKRLTPGGGKMSPRSFARQPATHDKIDS